VEHRRHGAKPLLLLLLLLLPPPQLPRAEQKESKDGLVRATFQVWKLNRYLRKITEKVSPDYGGVVVGGGGGGGGGGVLAVAAAVAWGW